MITQEEMKRLRKQAARRKRRIIMDNDGNDCVYYCKEATPEALLNVRTTGVIGTQVDTIMYCAWSGGFRTTINSKVAEVFACKSPVGNPNKNETWGRNGFADNKTADFIAQGTDCLEILVVRGTGKAVRQIGDRLIATKGVKHGQLVMTTTGKGL